MLHRNGISVMGKMMVLEGGILFVPLLVLPFYPKEIVLAWKFFVPAAVSIALGMQVDEESGMEYKEKDDTGPDGNAHVLL